MAWHRDAQRGGKYGAAWRKRRLFVLERDSYLCCCQHCKAEGRTALATEVDHIVSRAKAKALGWSEERTEDPANLQAINAECHKRKTLEEEGKAYAPPRLVGLDGFPMT